MKQMDDNIGIVLRSSSRWSARQHDYRVHDRQRSRDVHLPGRRHHPVQGLEDEHLGRRHARSGGHPLAGAHQARREIKSDTCVGSDWLPTFVEIAGGPKGDGLRSDREG